MSAAPLAAAEVEVVPLSMVVPLSIKWRETVGPRQRCKIAPRGLGVPGVALAHLDYYSVFGCDGCVRGWLKWSWRRRLSPRP